MSVKIKRRKTKVINVGGVKIGGNNPVVVQSMTNTKTDNVNATVRQIKELENAGCEIVRVAVPDEKAARSLGAIKKRINIPLVADIHFSHKLALESINQGIDKLRINPGNIGGEKNLKMVIAAAKKKRIPIRVGVNMGSLEKGAEKRYGRTAKAMVESALLGIKILEKHGFGDIIVSLKASDVGRTIEAYDLLAQKTDYPFHIGVTEAGTAEFGTIKSAIGLGNLLYQGIGDTIRVSINGKKTEEARIAWDILRAVGLRERGPEVIACPTCGRTEINLTKLVRAVEEKVKNIERPIKVAVMGCVVNGPGEAKEADIGIAGGKKAGVLFRKGKIIKTLQEKELLPALLTELEKIV